MSKKQKQPWSDTAPEDSLRLAKGGVPIFNKASISGEVAEITDRYWMGYTAVWLRADSLDGDRRYVWVKDGHVAKLEALRAGPVVLSGHVGNNILLYADRPPRRAAGIVNRVEITAPISWADSSYENRSVSLAGGRFERGHVLGETLITVKVLAPADAPHLRAGQLVRFQGAFGALGPLDPWLYLVTKSLEIIRDNDRFDPPWEDNTTALTIDGRPVINHFRVVGFARPRDGRRGGYTPVDVYVPESETGRRRRLVWMPTTRVGLLRGRQNVPLVLEGHLDDTGELHVDRAPHRLDERDTQPTFSMLIAGFAYHHADHHIALRFGFGENLIVKYSGQWADFGIDLGDFVTVCLEERESRWTKWSLPSGGLRKLKLRGLTEAYWRYPLPVDRMDD
jgi:hypothetical protein